MKSPVLKNVVAAVLGYIVMFLVGFVLFSFMWMVLGADGSFEPGLWDVSIAWIGASTVLGLIVAMSGGFACSKVGATDKSVAILIGLVIVIGVLTALGATPATAARPADVSMFDAMTSARSPTWIVWLTPVFGVIGVLLGAKLATTESD